MKRDKSANSFINKLQINWRGIKVVHRLEPHIIPVTLGLAVLTSFSPFINIVTTALIIDELLGAKSVPRLAFYVGISIGLNLLVFLTSKGLNRLQSVFGYRLYNQARIEISHTILNTDYENLERPELHLLKQKIDEARNLGENGIFRIPLLLGWFMTSLSTIIFSVLLAFPLFMPSHARNKSHTFIASPWPSGILLAFIILSSVFSVVSNAKFSKAMFESMDHTAPLYRKFLFYGGLISNPNFGKDARIYHMEDLFTQQFQDFGERVKEFFRDQGKMKGRFLGANGAFSALLGGMVYLFVGLKALTGIFSIGSFVKYAGAISQFISGLSELITSAANTWMNTDYVMLFLDFLDTPNQKYKGTLPVEKRSDNEYEIEFRNVSFQYPGTESRALRNLSIGLNIGERLAVVGVNGSGKTTFIKLLCRLYDPEEGENLLNGVNIQKYDYHEYLSLFSVVFQDFQLFAFSVGQNVAATVEYDRQRAMQCLDEADAAKRVRQMPKGIDTPLYKVDEGGIDISGGEAQKIALARALYKDAPFIVLDEPTAALDPIAEFDIYSKFNEMVGTKTAIYISHRLSSCRFCDKIAVFDKGELVQFGSHDELIKDDNGKYYALWNAQAQYYNKKGIS
ncbi:MAG: ABC transporter ATP-binding protein [Bacilli bacterium]